jgi:hypothetical protein
MRKNILFILILITIFTKTKAQIDTVEYQTQEFGMHIGAVTGLGLSYRYWTGNRGIQITCLPIKTQYDKFISLGLTGMYSLRRAKYYRAFLYCGNHLILMDNYSVDNLGVGLGFSFGRTVAFNLMFGYAGYDLGGEQNLLPTGEIGLYYKF